MSLKLLFLASLGLYKVLSADEFVRYNLSRVNDLAVCNDNTSAVYYFRAGFGDGINKWVIRQQGGGWCYDETSCLNRQKNSPKYTSSTLCPLTMNDSTTIAGTGHEGILSSNKSENPIFYNANQVYLWYCSSDSHLGNTTKGLELL